MPIPHTRIDSADDWQQQLRHVITSRAELMAVLGLGVRDVVSESGADNQVGDQADYQPDNGACEDFPIKVPRSFVQRMRYGDPRDPLLLQVLSSREEMLDIPGYSRDPVGETGATIPRRGIVHKYNGRVLLIVTGGCAVHCRYCFRRHFPYQENQNSRAQWVEALQYISADESIEEVILSGGDPLVVTDAQLRQLVEQIGAIKHVRRLRIHSRLPVVIPARVTAALLDAITHPSLQTVMVVHCNHAQEIDDEVATAIELLRQRGITVLNQAVLLAGINDNLAALLALSRRLFATGVLPYYLHLLDKVQGAAHFDLPEDTARQLMKELTANLPGYMVPKLVREIGGAEAKVGLLPAS